MYEMQKDVPYFEFFTDTIEDREQSEEMGRYVEKDVDCIKLIPKGGKLELVDYYDSWMSGKRRLASGGQYDPEFLRHVEKSYGIWKEGQEIPVEGTPIKGWSQISPATQTNIINANIRTVEDLANATEEGLSQIGMGARDLQRKAQAWLDSVEDHGKVTQELSNLKTENEDLRQIVERQQEQIAELQKNQKQKPGRKPRSEAA